MVKKWDHSYSLRRDADHVRQLQEASRADHGALVGSDEWWAAVADGTIPHGGFEGVVAKLYRLDTGELFEFGMTTADGAELTCAFKGDPTRYVEGLGVRFEYVTVEHADGRSGDETTTDVVTDVWIEHSHRRTQLRLHSFYPPPPHPI